jgi:hypothetical protein
MNSWYKSCTSGLKKYSFHAGLKKYTLQDYKGVQKEEGIEIVAALYEMLCY